MLMTVLPRFSFSNDNHHLVVSCADHMVVLVGDGNVHFGEQHDAHASILALQSHLLNIHA